MDIGNVRINGRVVTETGRIGRVTAALDDGRVYVMFGSSEYPDNMNVRDLTPVSDPCTDCPKMASMDKCCEYWKAACEEARRNATYWREELTKLQNEVLAEGRTIPVVARCCIQVEPDKLLMSQAARRVVEYLDIRNGPMDLRGIFEDCDLGQGELLDALAEARDARKIALVDGKYEIVRD